MPFLILIYALSRICESFSHKLCSASMTGESGTSYGYYYVTHSLVACIFFILSGGFSISINTATLLFSVALAAVILINMLVSMLKLRYMNVLGAGILTTPLNLLLIALAGNLLFGEDITLSVCLKILVTTVSAVLIFIDIQRNKGHDDNKENDKGGRIDLKRYVPLMLISVLLGVIQTLLVKAFVISERVTNEHSFYLLTNVFMLSWGVIMLITSALKGRGNLKTGLSFFKPRRVLSTFGNVVSSNVTSLVTVPILVGINISIFSPVSSAWSIVVSVIISLIFKEKLGLFSYLAAAVGILAIFV